MFIKVQTLKETASLVLIDEEDWTFIIIQQCQISTPNDLKLAIFNVALLKQNIGAQNAF